MAGTLNNSDTAKTQQALLQAALKCFAQKGYAGASIRDIVTAAGVSRPVLYYYFGSKADLYQALVSWAADERLRLMREAVGRADTFVGQLRELCATMFEFARANRELMRLAFATALAAPGEVPQEAHCFEKGWKSFEFLKELLEQGRQNGVLDRRFDSQTLAMGFGGLMHLHVMLHLLRPEQPLDRATAERVVDLFLRGAASDTHESQTPSSGNQSSQ